jgi:hypothetical protein
MLWRIPARANTSVNFPSAHDSIDAITLALEDTDDYALS